MRIILQRVSSANVIIHNKIKSEITAGLLLLLGIEGEDTDEDIEWLCHKIVNMRIFNDDNEKMNLSIMETSGDILIISQFTLFASTKKGNRPSFILSAKPEKAIPLYEKFIDKLEKLLGKPVQSGEFGADMKVNLCNDGPVTIFIDSKNRM